MAIIKSLLDLDFYKVTMGQFVFHRYSRVPVAYGLTNRTKGIALPDYINEAELRDELNKARDLCFVTSGLDYLAGLKAGDGPVCRPEYLTYLKDYRLPEFDLENLGGTYRLEFSGEWQEQIYWETIALSIITELFGQALVRKDNLRPKDLVDQCERRLCEKISLLRLYPEIKIIEFGTRRRFSCWFQDYVLHRLIEEIPNQLLGTSNVFLAQRYGLPPIGTHAHELFMFMSGIYHDSEDEIRDSHSQVLREWWAEYGYPLSIALTDTFGSDFFFSDFTEEQARKWRGLRQDSGDPIEFGEKAIKFYQSFGVDPREKIVVFSDGLDVHKIIKIYLHFKGRIQMAFGWGTNLTNDLGLPTLSLVVKAIRANGHGLVKLSDNLAKAIGAPEDVELYKRVFGYTGNRFDAVRY